MYSVNALKNFSYLYWLYEKLLYKLNEFMYIFTDKPLNFQSDNKKKNNFQDKWGDDSIRIHLSIILSKLLICVML